MASPLSRPLVPRGPLRIAAALAVLFRAAPPARTVLASSAAPLASAALLASVALPASAALPAPAALLAQQQVGEEAGAPELLVLRGGRLVDPEAGATREVTIVVEDGRIARLETPGAPVPAGARVLELGGRYALPGLIDAHVHISDFEQAERALRSGVTTARSAGVSHFADVGLRELRQARRIQAPELLAAGYHIRPEPAEGLFVDEPRLADLLESGVRTPEAVRRVAEAILDRGVDFVKTNATARAGLPETDPREPYYAVAELRALVEAAAERGVPVMAHAHGDEGGRAAVAAGVRSIEHGTYLSDSTLRSMAERGTYLVPTIAVVTDLTTPGGDYDDAFLHVRGRHMLQRVRETARRAHALGVRVVAATDTGYGPGSTVRIGHELEELVGIGMTPAEALRSATSLAAELLGVDDRAGRIAPGMDADLVVVDRDPLDDIRAVQDVLIVVNDGEVAVNRLAP